VYDTRDWLAEQILELKVQNPALTQQMDDLDPNRVLTPGILARPASRIRTAPPGPAVNPRMWK